MQRQHVVDRSKWPRGPWDDEPDRWEERHLGFPVLAVRNDLGAWCGYVGVPPGHPWHGRHYEYVDVAIHGGLTYSDRCQRLGPICHVPRAGEPADVWWLGFDCLHVGDNRPGDYVDPIAQYRVKDGTYRRLEYAQQQARRLAEQAAAAR